jgi:hypothetical protein
MKISKAALALIPLLLASTASAQWERYEFFGDYSYFRFDPAIPLLEPRSINGGGGGMQFNFNKWVGVKGEFQDYASTSWTVTYPRRLVTPIGIIPAGTYTSSNANVFTWVFGPVVRIPVKRVTIFGQTLFGGTYTNAYQALSSAIVTDGGNIQHVGSEHPFTFMAGGGVDLRISKLVSIRLGEADYVQTHFSNPLTDMSHQNGFRFVAGFVLKLGGEGQ